MIVIYHANCMDGFGAAWAAWCKYGGSAEYRPMEYGSELNPGDFNGKNVLMVDISWSREIMERLYGETDSLVVLDHHKSAKKELEGLDFAFFDMSRSGAVMTWEYLFPDDPVPGLLLYIQDRDLWQWKLSNSKAVSAALSSYPKHFRTWDDFEDRWLDLVREGRAILAYQKQIIEEMASHVRWQVWGGHRVPIVNAPVLYSEVCELLYGLHPEVPFVMTYHDLESCIEYQLRTNKDDFDVSEVAKLYGGGGHQKSAGFRVDYGVDTIYGEAGDE